MIELVVALLVPGCVVLIAAALAGSDPFYFLRGERVWIREYTGEWRCTRSRFDQNGVRWAYVYPFTKVGHVILQDDFTTTGESIFIKNWSGNRPGPPPSADSIESRNSRWIKNNTAYVGKGGQNDT